MKYVERSPVTIEAFKFTGEVTDELKALGILAPNAFQENEICPQCGRTLKNHALMGTGNRFQVICPFNYIIMGNNGIQLMSIENFEAIYKPLHRDVEDATYTEIIS